VAHADDFSTLKKGLEGAIHRKRKVKASMTELRRKPSDDVFKPPMVVYSKGFTKCVFCNVKDKVRFFDGLRSITGPKQDADLLRFLSAVMSSRLFKYITFHSGSNSGIGRDQIHVYESLALPFLLPDHDLAADKAIEIIRETAAILAGVENLRFDTALSNRSDLIDDAWRRIQPLVEAYYSVTDVEKMLIEDTLTLSQPSIHRASLDGNIPSLAFPQRADRELYADTLCDVLNRRARKRGIQIHAEGRVSQSLNLIFVTVIFAKEKLPYREVPGEEELWTVLERVGLATKRENRSLSYLRGFSYFEPDRLHMLKPATMRNWCRTAALIDADAIFEHLVRQAA
jgi:hypothetical protein